MNVVRLREKNVAVGTATLLKTNGVNVATALSQTTKDNDEYKEKDEFSRRSNDALSKMRFCYRATFFGMFCDILIGFIEVHKWSLVVAVELLQDLGLIGFGFGLVRVSRIYAKVLKEPKNSEKNNERAVDLFRTQSGVWILGSFTLALESMADSTKLAKHTSNDRWYYCGPVGIVAITLFTNFLLAKFSASSCYAEAKKQPTRSIGKVGEKQFKKICNKTEHKNEEFVDNDTVRSMGFLAVRNMAFCSGGFATLGIVMTITRLMAPVPTIEKALSMMDPVEMFVISGLVQTLRMKLLQVIIDTTAKKQGNDDNIYFDLFEAQKKYYGKIGKFMMSATIFGLLPYFYNGAKTLIKPILNGA